MAKDHLMAVIAHKVKKMILLKHLKYKPYLHFDERIKPSKVLGYIKNHQNVASHAFYPFLHYIIKTKKYINKKSKKYDGIHDTEIKDRHIFYSSHIDRYIYEEYAYNLNLIYQNKIKDSKLNNSVIAYRTDLNKSNINFAFETFNKIKGKLPCFVMCADFTGFFDNLKHKKLKEMLKKILGVKELNADYYNLFKSITKYSYVDRENIFEAFNITKKNIKEFVRICSPEKFREIVKPKIIKNSNDFGIPQGSPISSVLSNIYMFDFDNQLNYELQKYNSIFRRYCDDIILITPEVYAREVAILFNKLVENYTGLTINANKTEYYYFDESSQLDEEKSSRKTLDYLGFSFNGKEIKIREKTIFKYYIKLHQRINIVKNASKIRKRKSFRRRLYDNYTHLGVKKGKGNFISYAYRSSKIMNSKSIRRQVRNHWKIIHQELNKTYF